MLSGRTLGTACRYSSPFSIPMILAGTLSKGTPLPRLILIIFLAAASKTNRSVWSWLETGNPWTRGVLYYQGVLQYGYKLYRIILYNEVYLTGLYYYTVIHCRPGSREGHVCCTILTLCVPHSTLKYTGLYCTVPYCAVLYYTTLDDTVLRLTIL